jgi:hypothetical protein
MTPSTLPVTSQPIRSALDIDWDKQSTMAPQRDAGARSSSETRTTANASSKRSARFRSRWSASLKSS